MAIPQSFQMIIISMDRGFNMLPNALHYNNDPMENHNHIH